MQSRKTPISSSICPTREMRAPADTVQPLVSPPAEASRLFRTTSIADVMARDRTVGPVRYSARMSSSRPETGCRRAWVMKARVRRKARSE